MYGTNSASYNVQNLAITNALEWVAYLMVVEVVGVVSKLNAPWRQLFNIACKKMATSDKRQRVGYTLEFKMKVLEEVDKKRRRSIFIASLVYLNLH